MHDGYFSGFEYDYIKNIITFKVVANYYGDTLNCCFKDVFAFEMHSCEFWGKSASIYDFEAIIEKENQILINKILQENEKTKDPFSRLNNSPKLIELKITLISGDTLTIVCKELDVEKINTDKKDRVL